MASFDRMFQRKNCHAEFLMHFFLKKKFLDAVIILENGE